MLLPHLLDVNEAEPQVLLYGKRCRMSSCVKRPVVAQGEQAHRFGIVFAHTLSISR